MTDMDLNFRIWVSLSDRDRTGQEIFEILRNSHISATEFALLIRFSVSRDYIEVVAKAKDLRARTYRLTDDGRRAISGMRSYYRSMAELQP